MGPQAARTGSESWACHLLLWLLGPLSCFLCRAWELAFLTNLHAVLMLLVWELHFDGGLPKPPKWGI